MVMRESRIVASIAVAALFLVAPPSLHAQALTVDVTFVFHREKRDDPQSSMITKAPYPTENLLTDLQGAFPVPLPAGAKLVLIDFDHFQVQDVEGNALIADTSPHLRFAYSTYLSADKYDPETGAGKSTYVSVSTITVDFEGNGVRVSRLHHGEVFAVAAKELGPAHLQGFGEDHRSG
jgi:hypothetical protein